VNRSASAFPSDLLELPVFDYDGNCRIAVAYREHLFAINEVVLRVALIKSDPQLIIMLTRLLAVRTAGFGVEYYFQLDSPL
jgi:hypothetical protein